MITRRQFAKLSALAGAAVLLPFEVGCTSTQVQDSITVAAEVAQSAAAILSPVSPEYGAEVAAVGAVLKDAGSLYSGYVAAAAADRPGIAGKLHALLGTLAGNLSTILNDVRIKAPALRTEVSVAVAIVNTTITLILAHLPQTTTVARATLSSSQSLPVVKVSSAQGLADKWNQAVGAQHPEAVVTAPSHKRFF